MKKRNQSPKSNWIDIIHFDNQDDIPSYFRLQILKLDDKLASLISSYCRELGRPGLHTLRQWNQFWVPDSNLELLVSKPSRYCDKTNQNIKINGFLLYNKTIDVAVNKPCIYFNDLWIEPDFRCKHWASAMVRSVFNKNPGTSYEVSVMNPNAIANQFWKSMGFVTPIFTNYFYQDPSNLESED